MHFIGWPVTNKHHAEFYLNTKTEVYQFYYLIIWTFCEQYCISKYTAVLDRDIFSYICINYGPDFMHIAQ